MVKIRKPRRREFQYDKPMCLIAGYDCTDNFEPIDSNDKRHLCSNCKIAFEHKNRMETSSKKPFNK